jgi:hypothetical protein
VTATASGPLDRSSFADPSARWLAAGLLVGAELAAGGADSPLGLGTAVGTCLVLLTFDKRNPVSLRNFFVVYTVALFCIGVPLFHLQPALYADMVLFVVVFLSGYALSALRREHQPEEAAGTTVWVGHTKHRIHVVEQLMLFVACLQVLLLAVNISRYGIGGFYRGLGLIDQLSTYGKASVSGGVIQIATFLLKYSTLAVAIVYVQICLQARVKIRYRFLLLLLVVLPILSLSRSDALHGAGLLVVVNATARRIGGGSAAEADAGSPGASDGSDGPGFGLPRRRRLAPKRRLSMGITMVVAIVAGLAIGSLRQNAIAPPTTTSPVARSVPLLTSEISPIQAYSEIKANRARLKRQHGRTIVLPIVFKVIPRGLFPNKPINTGAYFMSVVRPAEFAAGFALPPTLFGDAYINFGMGGAVLACLLVGLVAARLDVSYKQGRLSRLPSFLIVYANFYALVRSPLSETLAGILLTAAAWAVLSRVLGTRTPKDSPAPAALQQPGLPRPDLPRPGLQATSPGRP